MHIRPAFPVVPRERVIVVGDTEADLAFVDNAHVANCWAKYGYGDREKCESMAANYRISEISELSSILLHS